MEEVGPRNVDNENQLSGAQRIHDTTRLLKVHLEDEGEVRSSTGGRSKGAWHDRRYDECCNEIGKAKKSESVKLPPLASLIIPRRTRYGGLLEKIPKPEGYLPRMHFPAWIDWPLHRKLPRIPIDQFIFSRGKLNQPLQRFYKRDYTTVDPHNVFDFLPASDYNALHDPATQRYLGKPHVQKLLYDQGLITQDSEVICSQKEINQYRVYLEHVQTTELNSTLREEEDRELYNYLLEKEVRKHISSNEDFRVRNALARERQKIIIEEQAERLRVKIREDKIRIERNRAEVQKLREEKLAESKRCDEYKKEQRRKIGCENTSGCREIELMEKQARAELAAYIGKMRNKLVKKMKQSDFIMAKAAFQIKDLAERKAVMEQFEAERHLKQKMYQKKMEQRQKEFPMHTANRKANERRILTIMRKFLDLWRAYVKRRQALRYDPNHQSSWNVPGLTHGTISDLQELSGREKFDTFILNLINLKHEMTAEMERAERAESQPKAGRVSTQSSAPSSAGKQSHISSEGKKSLMSSVEKISLFSSEEGKKSVTNSEAKKSLTSSEAKKSLTSSEEKKSHTGSDETKSSSSFGSRKSDE